MTPRIVHINVSQLRREAGLLVTNYHVVEASNRIEVHLHNGRVAVARIVGTAPTLDLALLQIDLELTDNETAYVLGGDIITGINGIEVASSSNIARALLESHPGDELRLTIFRDRELP